MDSEGAPRLHFGRARPFNRGKSPTPNDGRRIGTRTIEMIKLRALLAVQSLVLFGLLQSGCLVDSAHRCGSHQVLQNDLCICDPGYGLFGTACQACGENEVGSNDGCQCAAGFGRSDATEPCAATASLGQSCSRDSDCADAVFAFCAPLLEGGYCTNPDCTSSMECKNGYSCNARGTRSFCERPPTGVGQSCETSDDCAGLEASYCESTLSHSCLKNACKADPAICPGDWVCCDIALIRESLCLPPSQVVGGQCPGGGTLIKGAN